MTNKGDVAVAALIVMLSSTMGGIAGTQVTNTVAPEIPSPGPYPIPDLSNDTDVQQSNETFPGPGTIPIPKPSNITWDYNDTIEGDQPFDI